MSIDAQRVHSVHIPVMGTSFTIDTPIRVSKFGIATVMSIGDDELCETMRMTYSKSYNFPTEPIPKKDPQYRTKRITGYLNLVHKIVTQDTEILRNTPFESGSPITQYFEMMRDDNPFKAAYHKMGSTADATQREALQSELRKAVRAGSIDVNIMTKIDRNNYSATGELLPDSESDALSALRSFAESAIEGAVVFSAGFNRRLYAYLENFPGFFPDVNGWIRKRVILKVSDFRSSATQGKFLAKKGIWISENRVESGLNCGGHVFPTEGHLMGPILEEFKTERIALQQSLYELCKEAWAKRNMDIPHVAPETRLTVQGGIGTFNEDRFLLEYYQVDGTGWATPFLLVPEVTLVDDATRALLIDAGEKDLYTSNISPLGVPFNTVRGTASDALKRQRYDEGKPGSPCPKGHLVNNLEFTKKPICTASTTYQKRKIEQLKATITDVRTLEVAIQAVLEKTCLCEDLAAGALLANHKENKRSLAPTICPGPNLAYFSKVSTFSEMVGHIYGRWSVLNDTYRSNMFVNELRMYVSHFKKEVTKLPTSFTERQAQSLRDFQDNLHSGIQYYRNLVGQFNRETEAYRDRFIQELAEIERELDGFSSLWTFLSTAKTAV